MARLLESRWEISLLGSLAVGTALIFLVPFPTDDWLLQRILAGKPWVFYFLAALHHLLLFTTPFFVGLVGLSVLYIFRPAARKRVRYILLPPIPASNDELRLVIGETHHPRSPEPSEKPGWLLMFERGLFAGIAIIGAIGSGKTSCCMYPFAEQIFSFAKHIGGLVLEVKGDFCHKVRGILARHGREDDYIEINLSGSPYRVSFRQSCVISTNPNW